eukprot:1148755-Pelagomonas_calceolata.AAC.1
MRQHEEDCMLEGFKVADQGYIAVPTYKGSLAEAKRCQKPNQAKLVNKCVNWRRKQILELSSEVPNAKENHTLSLFMKNCIQSHSIMMQNVRLQKIHFRVPDDDRRSREQYYSKTGVSD